MQTLHLKPAKHQRIRQGHLWAFAGEISEKLSEIEPGDLVVLREAKGRKLGIGYVNPHSLIAVRLLTRDDEEWDEGLIRQRIRSAFADRKRIMADYEAYRLIYSESDGLPGLIVDNYNGHLVLQSLTAGMERLLDQVVQALKDEFPVKSIFFRGSSPFRTLEKLPEEDKVLLGEPPDEVIFKSDGIKLTARIKAGQKSGFFLDQSSNRRLLNGITEGKSVLDLFSYTGAWGLNALSYGAKKAVMVDTSQNALDWGSEDAKLNGFSGRCLFVKADAGEFLEDLNNTSRKFDVVVLDPPSLIPNRSSIAKGYAAYKAINTAAMRAVETGGYLVSCSCSYHLSRADHLTLLGEAVQKSGRRCRIVKSGGHAPDHPVLPGHPETEYLKCQVLLCE